MTRGHDLDPIDTDLDPGSPVVPVHVEDLEVEVDHVSVGHLDLPGEGASARAASPARRPGRGDDLAGVLHQGPATLVQLVRVQ